MKLSLLRDQRCLITSDVSWQMTSPYERFLLTKLSLLFDQRHLLTNDVSWRNSPYSSTNDISWRSSPYSSTNDISWQMTSPYKRHLFKNDLSLRTMSPHEALFICYDWPLFRIEVSWRTMPLDETLLTPCEWCLLMNDVSWRNSLYSLRMVSLDERRLLTKLSLLFDQRHLLMNDVSWWNSPYSLTNNVSSRLTSLYSSRNYLYSLLMNSLRKFLTGELFLHGWALSLQTNSFFHKWTLFKIDLSLQNSLGKLVIGEFSLPELALSSKTNSPFRASFFSLHGQTLSFRASFFSLHGRILPSQASSSSLPEPALSLSTDEFSRHKPNLFFTGWTLPSQANSFSLHGQTLSFRASFFSFHERTLLSRASSFSTGELSFSQTKYLLTSQLSLHGWALFFRGRILPSQASSSSLHKPVLPPFTSQLFLSPRMNSSLAPNKAVPNTCIEDAYQMKTFRATSLGWGRQCEENLRRN